MQSTPSERYACAIEDPGYTFVGNSVTGDGNPCGGAGGGEGDGDFNFSSTTNYTFDMDSTRTSMHVRWGGYNKYIHGAFHVMHGDYLLHTYDVPVNFSCWILDKRV